jgi:uncharacterized membrane protein YkvA (DUF1232 family)
VTNRGEDRPRDWFVLVYKLSPEPSRYRASVWRKLRVAGAIYLQNRVAALPTDRSAQRVMRGAAQEVRQSKGTAHLVRGPLVGDDAALVAALNAARATRSTGRCWTAAENSTPSLRRSGRLGNSRRRLTPSTWPTATPRTPWYAKVFATLIVGYVFSPIDPIPDFILGVGLLDEMVAVPIGGY